MAAWRQFVRECQHYDEGNGTIDKLQNYELFRYILFHDFPRDFGIDTIILARNGFYPTGKQREVICCCCQETVKVWKETDVTHKSGCLFFCERSPNIPWHEADANKLRRNIFTKNENMSRNQVVQQKQNVEPEMNSSENEFVVESEAQTLENYKRTFINWTGHQDDIEVWAKAGLKYTGRETAKIHSRSDFLQVLHGAEGDGENVICPYCKLKPRFESGDCPWELHNKYLPGCYFVMKVNSRGKIPSERLLLTNPRRGQDQFTNYCSPKDDYKHDPAEIKVNLNLRPEMGYKEKKKKCKDALASAMAASAENESIQEKVLCTLCMKNVSCIAFLPCHHLNCCEICAKKILICEVCKVPKASEIHFYR